MCRRNPWICECVLQKPLRRFLRVALITPLFVGCFYTKNFTNSHVKDVFQTLSRLLGCMLLFFFANVLKTLVAKIMASHFHKEAHFEKMQEALQKVIMVGVVLHTAMPGFASQPQTGLIALPACAMPCCAEACSAWRPVQHAALSLSLATCCACICV